MSLKENLNKIHINLINEFKNIILVEKSNHKFGNYVELIINENNREFKAIISKADLESNNFNWKYYSNPLLENSHLVERNSNVENFAKDVEDIFIKDRFDHEYIKNI